LLRPILTPRFALSCTDDLLSGLGKLAAEHPVPRHPPRCTSDPHPHIFLSNTHLREHHGNTCDCVAIPAHASYAALYNNLSLLGPTTILAHGCHLSDTELALVKKRRGISHCLTSNFNLRSGVARVGEWIDEASR
ncbi:hypothetical protein JB92DRAFT_2779949, partial [Gautieria morchelliformis]